MKEQKCKECEGTGITEKICPACGGKEVIPCYDVNAQEDYEMPCDFCVSGKVREECRCI